MSGTNPAPGETVRTAFGVEKPIVGMVHLLPLPSSPGWTGSMQAVLDRALRDTEALAAGGVDGIVVENYGDAPFRPRRVDSATVAAMAHVVGRIAEGCDVPVGVNVLRNDASAALAIAAATGARFIRVNVHTGAMLTDQGWLSGRADQTLRERAALGTDTLILADVFVKHAAPPPGTTIEQAAADAVLRGGADVLLVSGNATGVATDPADVVRVKRAVPSTPVWIASGLNESNARALMRVANGAIVGSAFQEGGRAGSPVSLGRVTRLLSALLHDPDDP
jgi:membrane complex biogenesis BtpA family protein